MLREMKKGKTVKSQCEEYDLMKWLEENHNSSEDTATVWTMESMPTKTCDSWQYDNSTFSSTVATEVRKL